MKKTKEKRGFEGVVKAIKSPAIHNLTPAVSSGSAAAELGYVYCKTNRHPTTVENVREEAPSDGVFSFSACPGCPGKQNILASLLQRIFQTRERGIFLLYGTFIPSVKTDAEVGTA